MSEHKAASRSYKRIGTRIYPVRTVAYWIFAGAVCATSLHFNGELTLQVLVFTAVALAYPHLAYQWYRQRGMRRQSEFLILLTDMFLIGWIDALLYFSPIVALIPLVINSASNLATAGKRLFFQGLLSYLVGALLFGAINSFAFRMDYAPIALLLSGVYLILGTHYIGFLASVQGNIIRKSRAQLLDQKQTIEKSSRALTASLNYARRIQEAILPFEDRIEACFGHENFFIFYRPLHIVSGDFYWIEQPSQDSVVVVVADCTGHGVPGAFMSLIGSKILDEVVLQKQIISPEQILEELHTEIRRVLKQEQSKNQDGMEAVVLTLDLKAEKASFSGAMNTLYYAHQGAFYEVRGSRKWLGGHTLLPGRQFELHENIPLKSTFYLCSDGFQDQFGGSENRKFNRKRFRQTLKNLQGLPMKVQENHLSTLFNQWKEEGRERQTDDVTIMGIRFD